ncbi:MAG TPA: thymidylate synthase [Candidatus Paceibacterota bacterium]|nr:thymidylate synthase [Candidatus Paceibacterota bacterium]
MNTFNKEPVLYRPVEHSSPDNQYEYLLHKILVSGKKKTSYHAKNKENEDSGHKYCLEIPGHMLQYYAPNGAPISTVRDLGTMYKGAIGEVVGFLNGAHTLDQLKSFGCPNAFWKKWVTKDKCDVWGLEEGDLGPGSYGSVLTAIPMLSGKTFNQVRALERQMLNNPFNRTNLITTWYTPLDMGDREQNSPRKVVVAPCHGNIIQFDVMDDRSMNMTLYQRSADTPIGLALNLSQWFAVGMMVAYVANLNFVWYTHFLPNAQIYDIQFDCVKNLIAREARTLPRLYLRPQREISSLTDFRKEDFELEQYNPHPKMDIPSAI